MALTPLQRDVRRLLAEGRRRHRDSFVADGAALGLALRSHRLSRDVGEAVLTNAATLFTGDAETLAEARAAGGLRFHRGRVGGAWPEIRAPESAP